MPKTVKRRKNKLAGRYRNRWPDEAEISGRMIPKWVADSCRNRWPDHPEICICRTKAERDHLKLVEAMLKIFAALFEADRDFSAVEPQLVTDMRLSDYNDWKALTRFEEPTAHTLELSSFVQPNTEITSKNKIHEHEYETFAY